MDGILSGLLELQELTHGKGFGSYLQTLPVYWCHNLRLNRDEKQVWSVWYIASAKLRALCKFYSEKSITKH